MTSPSPPWPQYGTSTHPPEVQALSCNLNHHHQHHHHPPPLQHHHHHHHHYEAPGKYSCNKISNFPSTRLVSHYHHVKMPTWRRKKRRRRKNIARVRICPDITILNSVFGLCILSPFLFVFLSFVFFHF